MKSYREYGLLGVSVNKGVATTEISAPPMNVMTLDLFRQLAKFGAQVAEDDAINVVVLRSADPDFFIAHFDVEAILEFPIEGQQERETELRGFHRMCETYRTMPKVTIAEIAGRAGGGGNELAMSCDMRFGAIGQTVINQMEVPLGILPGGTGTQRLPQLIGRSRAMEVVLGGGDIDAVTAEKWGLLNRAVPAQELSGFVDALASRIASYPTQAVVLAKQSILNAESMPPDQGRVEEAYLFQRTLRDPAAHARMRQFLAVGGQTRVGELNLMDTLALLE